MKIQIPSGLKENSSVTEVPDTAVEPQSGESVAVRRIDSKRFQQMLVEIATNAWKAQGRLAAIPKDAASPDHRRLERNVEAILVSLSEFGVSVKGHTGESYDYGQPLKVVAAQPSEGIASEIIMETIRPTIFWQEQLIQRGEVVIATPKEEG